MPGDQGGRVYVDWLRSGYDFADETQFPISGYNLYRRVSGTAIAAAAASASVQPASELLTPDGKTAWPLSGAEVFTVGGRTYVQGTGIGKTSTATFPTGTWVLVGSAFATQSDAYEMEVTTEADSSVWGINDAVFLVTAHTTAPSIWYVSEPDSGHSVDNIAPAVPTNFAVAYNTGSGNSLSWDPSPDADFQYFRVYRSSDPTFVPTPASLAQETVSPSWVDPDNNGAGIYYKVTALDYDGNESDPAEAGTVTAVEGRGISRSFALYPNVPNPFNPRTEIAFDVPVNGGAVSLVVYDASGRLVKTLVQGTLPAGRHTAEWDCHDAAERPVASGVYFYRLTARGVDLRKKMVLLK